MALPGQGGGQGGVQVGAFAARAFYVNGHPVVNNLNEIQQWAVNLSTYETITESLYDSQAYGTAGQNQLQYFQQPIGSGTGVLSGAAKSAEDTNMTGPGALPNMQAYLVTSIELDVQPAVPAFSAATLPAVFGAQAVASPVNDIWKIRATGFLDFQISSKSYLKEGPLMKYPASNDLEIDAAVADISTTGANMQSRLSYAKSVGPAYILEPNNLLLIPLMNFMVTLNWVTLQTVTTAARIFVRLMGQKIRVAQ
jgi:hypothetical protein